MILLLTLVSFYSMFAGVESQCPMECRRGDEESQQYLAPALDIQNAADIAANNVSYVISKPNTTIIFKLPPEINCSGTVTAINFCFAVERRDSYPIWPVFALSLINLSVTTVLHAVRVSSQPGNSNTMCASPHNVSYCCDTFQLEQREQFQLLPQSGIALGITVLDSGASLLGWNSSFTPCQVKRIKSVEYPSPGDSYSLEQDLVRVPLKLMQLHIVRDNPLMCSEIIPEGFYFPSFDVGSTMDIARENSSYDPSEANKTYIYPTLSSEIGCSGRVTAIEYCFIGKAMEPYFVGNTWPVFALSLLQKLNSTTYVVSKVIEVWTRVVDSICSRPWSRINYCCDTRVLEAEEQFDIPTSDVVYGITILTSRARLLGWNSRFQDYTINLHRLQRSSCLSENTLLSLNSSDEVEDTLKLVKFRINYPPDESTEMPEQPGTFCSAAQTTTGPPEIPPRTTVPPPGTYQSTAMSMPQGTDSSSDSNTTGGSSNSNFATTTVAAIAGSLVGFIIVLVVVMLIVIFITLKARLQGKQQKALVVNSDADELYDNAMYMGGLNSSLKESDNNSLAYDYLNVGGKAGMDVTEANDEVSYDYIKVNRGAHSSDYDTLNRNEDIYMAPPSDIYKLYAHLEDYRTDAISRDMLQIDTTIGSGQFGEVFRGVWHRSSTKDLAVAVKSLKKNCDDLERVKFLQEAAIMSQFRHVNVVTMYGAVTEGEPTLIVLEMLEGADLRNYLLSLSGNDSQLNEKELLGFCRHISSGMNYLSSKRFVHRDLAARNILVSQDGVCKIADFGMSRDLMDETYYVSKGGAIPVKWTAPEALHYKKYSTASDVWSFGVVLFEIWSIGHKPYEGITNSKVLKKVESGYRLPPPPGCPRAVYSIMTSCWSLDADQRPSFSHIWDQLTMSNSKLLCVLDEDKSGVGIEAFKLGADLHHSNNLFQDLQKICYTSSKESLSCNSCSSNDYI